MCSHYGVGCGFFRSLYRLYPADSRENKVLFIDPGFPIQKSQLRILGIAWESFDIHDFRGEPLRAKLESFLSKGDIAAIVYSNPNNPAWICLEESELKIIGELVTQYDAIVMEDQAYFCMDFRHAFGRPYQPPFVPTVARYTDNYILMLSASKISAMPDSALPWLVCPISCSIRSIRPWPPVMRIQACSGRLSSLPLCI